MCSEDHWRLLHEAGRAYRGAVERRTQVGGLDPILGQRLRHGEVAALAETGMVG